MRQTVFATFENPKRANEAFIDLIQQGVSYMDAVVLTRKTYRDSTGDATDGRLAPPDTLGEEAQVVAEPPTPADSDPFRDSKGGMWLIENMRYPGDLTECFKELGFSPELAHETETGLLAGGAIVVVRMPSGPVDEEFGSKILQRHEGAVLPVPKGNPYLG